MPTVSDAPYLGVVSMPSLTAGKTYYLKLTSNIRDISGNPLESNTMEGNWVMSFTTGWDTGGVNYGTGANMRLSS